MRATSGRLAVTYVTAPACHHCDRGREILDDLARVYPLDVREVALTSPEGVEALGRSRAPFPPVVLIEGRPIAYGRLSRRGLERCLDSLLPAAGGG